MDVLITVRNKLIVFVVACANVWVTFCIGYILYHAIFKQSFQLPFENNFLPTMATSVACVVWVFSFKIIPDITISDGVGKYKSITQVKHPGRALIAIMQMIRMLIIFVPVPIAYLAVGIRNRKCCCIMADLRVNRYTIELRKANLKHDNDNYITQEDFEEHFVCDNKGACIIKNTDSLTYLLLTYNKENILRSFGYLEERDFNNIPRYLLSMFDAPCPVTRKIQHETGQEDLTVDQVLNYVKFI